MTRSLRLLAAIVAVLLLSACVQMPTGGPVVESDAAGRAESPPGIYFDPKPPQPGQSPGEIVTNYLEAMTATPIKTSVARQFLTADAQESWEPEQRILTYAEASQPLGREEVRVRLDTVNEFDHRGAWQGVSDEQRLTFGLALEEGEWRIDRAPDALVVPQSWFEDWYRRVALYFFDPSAEILVPEPVFVPRGDQFATSLVRGLLEDPAGGGPAIVRSFFPPGLERPLSVPISAAGVADVNLEGDAGAVDEETTRRMLTQLTWTLRQDQRIRAVRLRISGEETEPQGPVAMDIGGAFDPTGADATGDLFGLLDGRLVRGDISDLRPTAGPMGAERLGVRSVGLNLRGTRVAGVSGDGTSVLVAPVDDPDGTAVQVVSGGTDILQPTWDFTGRMWLADVGRGGTRIMLLTGERVRTVRVPGISGRDVGQLLVSRDGTRLVALVRSSRGDSIRVARLVRDNQGGVRRATRARSIPLADDSPDRIQDVGWRTPTSLSVLSVITNDLSQVRTISVEGSPGDLATPGTTRLRGRARQLVSSPVEGANVYVVAGRAVNDVTVPERTVPSLPRGLSAITYVG